MAALEQRLGASLRTLRCPAYLEPTAERVAASSYRRTLLLWLFAIYRRPSARENDQWVREEPTDEQLIHWLCLVLSVPGDAHTLRTLLHEAEASEQILRQLLLLVETVQGRVALEEQGKHTILQDASDFLSDIAANQESVFDTRCELFPTSIQLMTNELRHGLNASAITKRLDDDIASLRLQREALDQRIVSAKSRLDTLTCPNTDKDSKVLSQELGQYLVQVVELIHRATVMLRDDLSPWMNLPKPQLIGVGQAATGAYESLDSVLAFLENTQSFADHRQDHRQVQATVDIAKDCQELVDCLAPQLRDQLKTLEAALGVTKA